MSKPSDIQSLRTNQKNTITLCGFFLFPHFLIGLPRSGAGASLHVRNETCHVGA